MLHPLWVTETYPPSRGGMAQSCDRIVHALRGAGALVDLVHLSRRAVRRQSEMRLGGRDLVWPVGDDAEHALRCLWEHLASEPPPAVPRTHVVAFGGVLPLLAAPVFAALWGLPLVTLLRGNDLDLGLFSLRRTGLLERSLPRSRRVAVVSEDARTKVAALFPEVDVEVVGNGIDLAAFRPVAADLARAAAWRRESVQPDRRVLGIFGQIKPKKGGLFFLEALAASGLADRFHLLFVGDLGEEVTAWLADRGAAVAHTVEPHADRYDLLSRYPACDLVVLPSFYDGMPNVLIEALALGVPPLAARTGGMADLLRDGETAFLFAPGDDEGCRRALARAAEGRAEDLAAMGERCRRLAAARLGHDRERDRYLAILRDTLAGRRPSVSAARAEITLDLQPFAAPAAPHVSEEDE